MPAVIEVSGEEAEEAIIHFFEEGDYTLKLHIENIILPRSRENLSNPVHRNF